MSAPAMVSGFGQFHTDEPGKLDRRPYDFITLDRVRALVDHPQQVEKSRAQWLIPSTLASRSHKKQAASGQFWILWADIDHNPAPIADVAFLLDQLVTNGCQYEVYASRSATVDRQKCRILIPLDQPLQGVDWLLCQKTLNDKLAACGIEPDRASEGAGQLLYLPNRGAFYASESNRDGQAFQPLFTWQGELAAKVSDIEEKANELAAKRQAAAERRASLAAEDTSGNLIQAFNDAFPVEEILLRAGYDQYGDRFRHPQSESGSFSASVRDSRVHSLSGADPLYTGGSGGGAHDAFSAFRVLYAGGDQDTALQIAGNQWLTIGGENWNAVKRREYARQQAEERVTAGFDVIPEGDVRERFKLLTPSELAALPPVRWRVRGVLPETGIGAIYGPSGAGKSFLILDMLACIAAGREWFGYKTNAAPVVYIALEGEAGIAQRVQAWQQVHGAISDGFRVIVAPLDIRKLGDRAGLLAAIRETGLVGGLIAIDTLNQSAPGLDENDSSQMGLAIAGVKTIQRDLGGLVVLVHHSGKDASKGLRGHSSLLAALDASLEVSRDGDQRSWTVGKSKDGGDGAGHSFELETVSLGADDDLEPITSCVVRPVGSARRSEQPKAPTGGNQKIVWDALQRMFREVSEQPGWELAERPRISVESAVIQIRGKLPVESSRQTERVRQAIAGLAARGLIDISDEHLMPVCMD